MQSEDLFEAVSEGLDDFEIMFPLIFGKDPDDARKSRVINGWVNQLDDLPAEVVSAGFKHIAKTHKPKFYADIPNPAMLRDWVLERVAGSWTEAYNECHQKWALTVYETDYTCPKTGERVVNKVEWSSPLVQRAFKAYGGSAAFKEIKPGDRTAAAQFRETFNAIKQDMQSDLVERVMLPQAQQSQAAQLEAPKIYREAPKALTPSVAERGEKIMNYISGQAKHQGVPASIFGAIERLSRHEMPKVQESSKINPRSVAQSLTGTFDRFQMNVEEQKRLEQA